MLVSDYSEKPWQWKYAEPSEAPEPFWIEVHDNIYWRKLVWDNPNVPYYACAVYLGIIFGLKRLMRDRAPVKAQAILVSWNLFLAIFSFMGFFRVSQELTGIWKEPNGFHKSLCVREGRGMATDYWGLLFLLSKFIELGDTVFIVLRKQPLLALQWYHHCLVTLFSWKLYPWNEPIISWYAFMNYGIHQVMYLYFALRGLKVKVPEILAMAITSLQTMQMVVGLGVNLYTVYVQAMGQPCARHPTSVKFSLFVYFSLWVLFMKFFYSRYSSKSHLKTAKQA